MKNLKTITIKNPSPELIKRLEKEQKLKEERRKELQRRYEAGEFDKYFKGRK